MVKVEQTGSAWRTVRRELAIGALWGAGLMLLVLPFMLPKTVMTADGRFARPSMRFSGPDAERFFGPRRDFPLTTAQQWLFGLATVGQGAAFGACIGAVVGLAKGAARGQLKGKSEGERPS